MRSDGCRDDDEDHPDTTTANFVPGFTLSRRFFNEVVEPIIARQYSTLRYAAALIGPGSEVLGFDTPISTDHHWGPRAMLFLREADYLDVRDNIEQLLGRELPFTFMGYSTNFGPPDEIGVRLLVPIDDGPVSHRVEITTVDRWFRWYLDWHVASAPTTREWLTFPQHRLRAATSGSVFRDDGGELRQARSLLAWYPDDIWYYMLAAQWNRIAEAEAFMARCGDVGDELGSTLVASRIAKDIMHLCFLMEREYAPYAKWLGSEFERLRCGSELAPILTDAIRGSSWQERQAALSTAYELVASMHNALGITEPLDPQVRQYYGRPYLVIGADRFASAIECLISDEVVKHLPPRFGSLNQIIDATDRLEPTSHRTRFSRVYD